MQGLPNCPSVRGRATIETFGSNAKPSVFETREFIVDANKGVVPGYEVVTATEAISAAFKP